MGLHAGADREAHFAVRLGMRMIGGLRSAHAAEIVAAREGRLFGSVEELWRRSRVPSAALELLAGADAFRDLGLHRRAASWAIRGLPDDTLPLFAAADRGGALRPELVEATVPLVPIAEGRNVVEDYATTGLILRQHPIVFLRDDLRSRGLLPCAGLARVRNGQRVEVAGLVLVRQRPGTVTGVIFITLEVRPASPTW